MFNERGGLADERRGPVDEGGRLADERRGPVDKRVGIAHERCGMLDEGVWLLDQRSRVFDEGVWHVDKRRRLVYERVCLLDQRLIVFRQYPFLFLIILRHISIRVKLVFVSVWLRITIIRLGFAHRLVGFRLDVGFVILNKRFFRAGGKCGSRGGGAYDGYSEQEN